MEERRKQKRSLCFIDVFDQKTGEIIGNAGDIHHEGLNLISKDKIPLLSDLSIYLQDPVNEITIPLIIKGVWNRMNKDPVCYNTGCLIVDPTPEIIYSISDLLENSIKSVERRFISIPSSVSAVNV